jgi:hypothetical protein
MVEAQTTWFGDGLCTSGDHERELLLSFYHCWCPGGVTFSCLVIIKSITHTHLSWSPLLSHFVKFREVKSLEIVSHFFFLNYLNLFHTNSLISSLMLRTGLLVFWPKYQHRFLVITFLLNFGHTNCFISEFDFCLRIGIRPR